MEQTFKIKNKHMKYRMNIYNVEQIFSIQNIDTNGASYDHSTSGQRNLVLCNKFLFMHSASDIH